MKQFKKKTLALVLASVVTVVGSFAAENYKNSIMALNFEANSNSSISMIVETKTTYNGNISPIKRDANTYVLMLPEVNSLAPTPDLKNIPGGIESVNIRTMPYSSNGKGYTRITIKTTSPIALSGKNKIFIPTQINPVPEIENKKPQSTTNENFNENINKDEFESFRRNHSEAEIENVPIQENISTTKDKIISEPAESEPVLEESYFTPEEPINNGSSHETIMLILGFLLVITSAVFFYIKAKNKLAEIAGEKLEIDVEDEEEKTTKQKEKRLKKIQETVKTLDKTYSKTAVRGSYTAPVSSINTQAKEDLNIVDLDELFKEQISQKDEEENQALEDFLSGFSFYEEDIVEEPVEEVTYDENLYKETLANTRLRFNKEDILCINKLLASEIQDDTIKNIDNYLVSNPIKESFSKEKFIENYVTELALSQNITFRADDMNILNSLMSVELDSDFISDLRTNPTRYREMAKELSSNQEKTYKPSEIITLSVKDMLPNLSEELQKQGKKEIESNYKPETIYFQKGYDVDVLSTTDKLPDLTKEIHNKKAYLSKPSAEIELVDNSYDVSKLKVSESLSNIGKLLNEDINKKENKKTVDEKTLLKSIENIKFKPLEKNHTEDFVIDLDATNNASQAKKETDIPNKILDKIAEQKTNQQLSTKQITKKTAPQVTPRNNIQTPSKKQEIEKCIVENESYTISSSVNFTKNLGCHLAKNENGYAVLSYVGDKVTKIKHFKTLKSEKIQARLSDKLEDNTLRYIIRIGINKFIVDVKDNSIKYIMDLC
ncbi:MAG: hypothetical protein E7Z92_05660 [Cyanobacteria bacterium SIG31]|nr:hypothetical protein [Cyanobacteria bacterium SIG31]